jgi:hypothetical protein
MRRGGYLADAPTWPAHTASIAHACDARRRSSHRTWRTGVHSFRSATVASDAACGRTRVVTSIGAASRAVVVSAGGEPRRAGLCLPDPSSCDTRLLFSSSASRHNPCITSAGMLATRASAQAIASRARLSDSLMLRVETVRGRVASVEPPSRLRDRVGPCRAQQRPPHLLSALPAMPLPCASPPPPTSAAHEIHGSATSLCRPYLVAVFAGRPPLCVRLRRQPCSRAHLRTRGIHETFPSSVCYIGVNRRLR